jgi:putative transposase
MVAGEQRGFDAGKRVKGRKRHIIVDTLGLLLAVVVQSASVQDRNGADEVIQWMKRCWQKVNVIFADAGYRTKLVERIKTSFGIEVEIVKKKAVNEFAVLPKRWIVERTFAWLDTNRRNSKDYERLTETSQAIILLSSIRLMLLKS